MMIRTIVMYSKRTYVIFVTQIEGIQVCYLSDLLFPELWPFQISYKSVNFLMNKVFFKSSLPKTFESQNDFKHVF